VNVKEKASGFDQGSSRYPMAGAHIGPSPPANAIVIQLITGLIEAAAAKSIGLVTIQAFNIPAA